MENNKLILKTQQRCKCERKNAFTQKLYKRAWSLNYDNTKKCNPLIR